MNSGKAREREKGEEKKAGNKNNPSFGKHKRRVEVHIHSLPEGELTFSDRHIYSLSPPLRPSLSWILGRQTRYANSPDRLCLPRSLQPSLASPSYFCTPPPHKASLPPLPTHLFLFPLPLLMPLSLCLPSYPHKHFFQRG